MTATNTPSPSHSRVARARGEVRAFLEIFALCGFAIAQPLLDVFGKAPSEFIFRNADSRDIVLFGVLVTVVPALALWAVDAVVGLISSSVRRWVHLGILAALVALFTIQILKEVSGLRGLLLGVLAILVAAGFAALYLRAEATRTWLGFAAIGPVAFLGLFLFSSPTSELLSGNEAAAAQLDGIDDPAPVVLVVLDEFPLTALIDSDGNLDEELYPNFARFAEIGTWYNNATAVSQYTSRAVPAILTGQYPEGRDDPLARDHPESLFTLLGDHYELSVDESTTRMCPSNLCEQTDDSPTGTATGLGALLDDAGDILRTRIGLEDSNENPTSAFVDDTDVQEDVAPDAGAASDDQELPNPFGEAAFPQPERFEALLTSVSEPGPRLSYLHMLLPHVPYRYLPDGTLYPEPEVQPGDDEGIWIDDTAATDLGRQRELLQVGYADALVGELIDTMQEAGTWDDALVIVTADHGSAFLPGLSQRGTGRGNWNDALFPQIAWVPLFVHYPDQGAGETSEANVETVDIVPTVADVLGVEIPWEVDGLSMLDPDARPGNDKVFYESFSVEGHVDAGERVELDGDTYHPRVLAQGVDSLLPAAGEPLRWWRVGPGRDLVGQAATDIGVLGTAKASATVDQAAFTRDVDPDAPSVPAYLSGHLDGTGPGETVAVALNGRIGGVATTFGWDGHDRFFAVMLPPEFLVAGRNEIDVYLVRDGGLEPVGL